MLVAEVAGDKLTGHPAELGNVDINDRRMRRRKLSWSRIMKVVDLAGIDINDQ